MQLEHFVLCSRLHAAEETDQLLILRQSDTRPTSCNGLLALGGVWWGAWENRLDAGRR